MGGVAGWFERRGEIPLACPPGIREYGPVSDDPDRPDGDSAIDTINGVAFALEYCDLHGWVSTRTVRCFAIDPVNPVSIKAYCNVRGATRTFRLDRIVSIANLRTGHILTGAQHVALLAPYLPGQSDDSQLPALCELQSKAKDGVFALLQLAMARGRLRLPSRQMIVDYVRAEADATQCPLPPTDTIGLWVDNLSPPLDAVIASVNRLLDQKEKLARLLPWLLKVARGQDSFVVQDEAIRELIAEIRTHFRDTLPDAPAHVRATRQTRERA
jgi:hypothetical protein